MYEDARKMYRTKILVTKLGKVVKTTFGRPRLGKNNGQAWRGVDMVQKVFGISETKNGTEACELL